MGDVYSSRLGQTVTRTDNQWFTLLTLNTNQMHFNEHYAEGTPFGQPLVNSAFTLALVTGMTVPDTSENATANLSWTDIKLPRPVFEGDTLWAESEILELRESASRPNVGIVSIRTRGINQKREVVIEFRRTFMVYKRDAAEVTDTFPHTDADGRSETRALERSPMSTPAQRLASFTSSLTLDDIPSEVAAPPSCTCWTRSAAAWRRTPSTPRRTSARRWLAEGGAGPASAIGVPHGLPAHDAALSTAPAATRSTSTTRTPARSRTSAWPWRRRRWPWASRWARPARSCWWRSWPATR